MSYSKLLKTIQPELYHNASSFEVPDTDLQEVLDLYCGRMFLDSKFQLLTAAQSNSISDNYTKVYPDDETVIWFARNWMGNPFGIVIKNEKPSYVRMMDFGTGELFEVAASVTEMIDEMLSLPDDRNGFLDPCYYDGWIADYGRSPKIDECIGYKIPLFAGGEDNEDNLELIDLDVYWTIMADLMAEVRRKLQK